MFLYLKYTETINAIVTNSKLIAIITVWILLPKTTMLYFKTQKSVLKNILITYFSIIFGLFISIIALSYNAGLLPILKVICQLIASILLAGIISMIFKILKKRRK